MSSQQTIGIRDVLVHSSPSLPLCFAASLCQCLPDFSGVTFVLSALQLTVCNLRAKHGPKQRSYMILA